MDVPILSKHPDEKITRLEAEKRALQERLHVLTSKADHNQNVLHRFYACELLLLTTDSLPELFERLTTGMQNAFALETVHLFLEDRDHEWRHLLMHTGLGRWNPSRVRFVDRLEQVHPLFATAKKPFLGPYHSSEHGPLLGTNPALRSMAVLPLYREDMLVGRLVLGSGEAERYTAEHATDFLHHLSSIAAVCLENTLNRERLVLSGMTDTLTGLHNRRYLERRLPEEISRALRYGQPMSCLFIDADHFKRINDTHGHPAGDLVLRALASRIRSALRGSDIAVRYGGEEFAILLPQTALKEARGLAERIRSNSAKHLIGIAETTELQVTLSIGLSTLNTTVPGSELETLADQMIARADDALYQAKSGGRNRVVEAGAN